jgi:hypothetical protein
MNTEDHSGGHCFNCWQCTERSLLTATGKRCLTLVEGSLHTALPKPPRLKTIQDLTNNRCVNSTIDVPASLKTLSHHHEAVPLCKRISTPHRCTEYLQVTDGRHLIGGEGTKRGQEMDTLHFIPYRIICFLRWILRGISPNPHLKLTFVDAHRSK